MGRAIQAVRERANLSQEQLAERLGVARQTVSRYEAGRPPVLRSDLQRQIAEALGFTVADLMTERDNLLYPDFAGRHASPAPTVAVATQRTVVTINAQPELNEDGEVYYVDAPDDVGEDLGWMFGPNAGFLRLAEGSLPEGIVSARLAGYDRSAWPRAGQGCVLEMKATGELLPRIYQRRTAAGYLVTAGAPQGEHTVDYKLVKGVYAIRFYGD